MGRRNSLRLENHDYSSRGNYFITICTHQREYFFGLPDSNDLVEKVLQEIVADCWHKCLSKNIASIAFVVMPNHLHGILRIKQSLFPVGAIHESSLLETQAIQKGSLEWIKARRQMLLSKVIGKFKMQSSKQVNNFLEDNFGERPFKLQRNYYDHIIRNAKLKERIIHYINTNPERWAENILNRDNSNMLMLKPFLKTLY